MPFAGILLRVSAAFALSYACGATALASTPAPIWGDLAAINVLCLVRSDAGVDQGPLHDRICTKVRDMAAKGAPAAVRIIAPGDPALLAPDSVTLLVHVSVQPASPRPLAAFSIRPFRNAPDQAQMIFAAAPRAAPLGHPAGGTQELEAALRAALSETLPWFSAPAGPRPIR